MWMLEQNKLSLMSYSGCIGHLSKLFVEFIELCNLPCRFYVCFIHSLAYHAMDIKTLHESLDLTVCSVGHTTWHACVCMHWPCERQLGQWCMLMCAHTRNVSHACMHQYPIGIHMHVPHAYILNLNWTWIKCRRAMTIHYGNLNTDPVSGPVLIPTALESMKQLSSHALSYPWHTHTHSATCPMVNSASHTKFCVPLQHVDWPVPVHTQGHSPSCTEQGQAGLSCCSSVSYSQDTHTSHPWLPYSRGGSDSTATQEAYNKMADTPHMHLKHHRYTP